MVGGSADRLLGRWWKCCCFLFFWLPGEELGIAWFLCLLVGVTGAYLCRLLAFLEQWWLVLFFLFSVIAAKEVL